VLESGKFKEGYFVYLYKISVPVFLYLADCNEKIFRYTQKSLKISRGTQSPPPLNSSTGLNFLARQAQHRLNIL